MEPFDVILAADCVYFEPAFPLLIQTLKDLAGQNEKIPDFLFCCKKRRKVRPFSFFFCKRESCLTPPVYDSITGRSEVLQPLEEEICLGRGGPVLVVAHS
jgi:hypothetical protein